VPLGFNAPGCAGDRIEHPRHPPAFRVCLVPGAKISRRHCFFVSLRRCIEFAQRSPWFNSLKPSGSPHSCRLYQTGDDDTRHQRIGIGRRRRLEANDLSRRRGCLDGLLNGRFGVCGRRRRRLRSRHLLRLKSKLGGGRRRQARRDHYYERLGLHLRKLSARDQYRRTPGNDRKRRNGIRDQLAGVHARAASQAGDFRPGAQLSVD
jgi:hypothetical protein